MITINFDKAKTIAHQKRRAARSEEFAPHDQIISKQIPGQTEKAEQERKSIREKYSVIQTDIDNTTDINSLKQVLNNWNIKV